MPTSEIQKLSGVDEILSMKEFERFVAQDIGDKFVVAELDDFKDSPLLEVIVKRPNTKLIPMVDKLRWRKSLLCYSRIEIKIYFFGSKEKEMMRETCKIGSAAINTMIRDCKMVPNEAHISGKLEFEYRRRGAFGSAYRTLWFTS